MSMLQNLKKLQKPTISFLIHDYVNISIVLPTSHYMTKKMTSCKALLLMTLVSTLFGCGKPVKDSESTNDEGSTVVNRPGATVSMLELSLAMNPQRDSIASSSNLVAGDAWARIPESVFVSEGSPLVISSKVYLNTKETSKRSSPELFCSYTSIRQVTGTDQPSPDGYNHYFKGCYQDVDNDGQVDELNYIPGDEIAVDKGNYIVLSVQSDNSVNSLVILSEIELRWL